MNYLQFDFETENKEEAEMLLALLSNAGFEGFEETGHYLKAFINESAFDEAFFSNLIAGLTKVNYTRSLVAQQNWNAQWESSFEPIVVGDFVSIRAGFHQPNPLVKYEIVITPKMSFGTGHHATTYQMVEQMEAMDFTGKKVVDFGTGTGILAILAEKMGAASVVAIDNDDWSINNAKENLLENSCSRLILQKADSIEENTNFDIILANINLHVILANMKAIKVASVAGTIVLLSGFLITDEAIMMQSFKENGFNHLKTTQKGDWLCIAMQRI